MRITAICFRNLKRRRLRTILCISGITLAVTFLVGIGAATSRITATIEEMNSLFEDEIIVVSRDVFVIQGFPIGGVIPETIVNELNEIEGIEDIIPMIFILDLKTGEVSRVFPANITIGLPLDKLPLIFSLSFLRVEGNIPSEPCKEVLVGGSIADQYGLSIGDTISYEEENLTLSGIIRGPSIILSRSIIMSLELAQKIYKYNAQISMAVVKPDVNADVEKIASEIESRINYVMALTENERNELTNPVLDQLKIWDWGIKLFSLSISAMLIAIVEIINVSESRRDFATLIAIGASKSAIFRMVVTETILIGLFGGLLGLLFGGIVAVFIASSYTSIPALLFIQSFFDLISPYLIVEVLLLTLVTCCISGVIPAVFALRINVNEALRAEY